MDGVFGSAVYVGAAWLAVPCLTTIVTVLQSRPGNVRGPREGSARLPLPGLVFEEPATTVEILLKNRGPAPVQVLSAELPPAEWCEDDLGDEAVLRGVARVVAPGEAVVYHVRPHTSPPPAGFDVSGGNLAIYPRPVAAQARGKPAEPLIVGLRRRLSRALRVFGRL